MSNEKFISLDNLRQYDEFLDEELNKIKDTVDKEFTFNVKYAESDEIGGAAIKAVNDETGENIAKHFSDVESAIAINKTTLGYQRKNLLPYPSYTKWVGSRTFTWDNEGYMTSADANATTDVRLWEYNYANRSIYLEAGTYTYSVHVKTAPTTGQNRVVGVDENNNKLLQVDISDGAEVNFTLTENKVVYLIEKVNNGSVAAMIRHADIIDNVYEPYVNDVDTRIIENKNNITINKTTLGYQKKNLLNNTNVTKTEGGVTFTVNADKSVSLSGTSTGQVFLYFDFDEQLINNQKVILSGCPSGGNSNTYALAVRYYNESGAERYAFDTGSEIIVTPADVMQIILVIRAGVNTDGLIFYPMLRYADVIDDTYEPYVDDVDTRITDNKNDIAINKTTLGYQKKNLLKNNASTRAVNGITFTVNNDKSVTLNGTATAQADLFLRGTWGGSDLILPKGDYIASIGVEQDDSFTGCALNIVNGTNVFASQTSVYPSQVLKNVSITGVYIAVSSGRTFNNYTLYPMIRSIDVADDTYEPYIDDVDTRIIDNDNEIALNKTTLGYQKKNLLKNTSSTKTVNGITFTKNADGSITVPTFSNLAYTTTFNVATQITLDKGTYILSGDKELKSSNIGDIRLYVDSNTSYSNKFTLTEKTTITSATIFIYANTSNSSAKTVYPMLRYADITDDTYEPYIDDVDTRITDSKNDIAVNQSTLGYTKKNLLPIPSSPVVIKDVTISYDNDGYMTSNATADARQWTHGNANNIVFLKAGTYIYSTHVKTAPTSNGHHFVQAYDENDNTIFACSTAGNYISRFTLTEDKKIYIIEKINNGCIATMIRKADITDGTYEPYVNDVDTRIVENKSDIKINETTLGYTKKNLLKPLHPAGTTGGWGGKTYKFNSDGSFTVSGTATGELAFCFSKVYLTKGTYILSSTAGFDLQLFLDGNYVSGAYVNNDTELVIATDGTYEFKWWHGSGTSISTTIYPMLRYPDVIDSTFEPYVESVNERLQNFVKSGSEAKAGLVPAPSTTAGTTKYLREDGTWQVPPNTNTVGKTIDGNYKTSFRTQTKGNSTAGDYLSNIRNDTASVSGSPQFGSGLAFGRADTHGYLYTSYSDAEAYIGGGNADNLKWVSKISLDGHTHNYLPLSGGTMNKDAIIKMPITHDGRYSEFTGGNIKNVAPTGGWAMGIGYYQVDGSTLMADIGVYGSGNTLNYYYMGPAFDNPLFTLDNSGNANFKGSVSATSFNGYTLGSMSTKNNLSTKIYSSTNSSGITTITIDNLFNKYSMIFINAIGNNGGVHTYLIPLQILKSKVNLGYSDSSNFNVQYINDSSFMIFEYMGSGTEKYTTVEVYAIY